MKTIKVGSISAESTSTNKGWLKIDELSNSSEVKIPVIIVNGKEEGPILWLNSCIHGDELTGIIASRKIALDINPENLNGTLICTLISNPLAYQGRQKLTPQDGLNLCDSFPGNKDGQMTEKIAYMLFEEIKDKADYLIDFHSWGFPNTAKPYAVFKISNDQEVNNKTEEITKLFGSPLICKIDTTKKLDEPAPVGGALDLNCAQHGIPSFMAEIGHAGRLEDEFVDFGVNGVKNIMRFLKMIHGKVEWPTKQIVLTSRWIIRCKHSGLAIIDVEPQHFVKKGERLAHIVDVFGDIVEEILAPQDIYPISMRYEPVVNTGDRIAFVGSVA